MPLPLGFNTEHYLLSMRSLLLAICLFSTSCLYFQGGVSPLSGPYARIGVDYQDSKAWAQDVGLIKVNREALVDREVQRYVTKRLKDSTDVQKLVNAWEIETGNRVKEAKKKERKTVDRRVFRRSNNKSIGRSSWLRQSR